ncbi:MAG: zinc ABC transporter substrate-binding protein [Ruminococcus sp.]|nr:zinc ABC transporter substrate-binding protein [Ruminococcus sp.]
MKNIERILPLSAVILLLVTNLTACQTASGQTTDDRSEREKISVVTTIFPQYDFVREVAGDNVELQMLLKPGEETHSYEPTPQDIIAILHADLFIYVGGENDVWVEEILEMPEMKEVHTLKLVDCVDTLSEHEHEHTEECEEEHEHIVECEEEHSHTETCRITIEHEHTGEEEAEEGVHTFDEHVWTSPVNAISITEHITEELCELDSVNAKIYEENCKTYIVKLEELDEQFHEVVESAKNHTLLFGDRYPFKYFEEEYGLSHYAAFSGCASDTEPSAAIMAYLIDKVEEEQIPVVLKMELSNESISQAIAEATGTEVKVFYSCHNLSAEQFEAGENYLSMMQENVNTLKEALKEWH